MNSVHISSICTYLHVYFNYTLPKYTIQEYKKKKKYLHELVLDPGLGAVLLLAVGPVPPLSDELHEHENKKMQSRGRKKLFVHW